ncbi:MAG: YtxH domain-containing protein, partial [Microbacteriaceae bacterium]|nr:YtxH domain-containing protein [Microbacteriaceae bacterium]
MRGKILFLLGLGVGYVFGTRAGRARYKQMKTAALKVWNDPRVQEQVSAATDFVKENAPEVASAVSENVKKIAERVDAFRSNN